MGDNYLGEIRLFTYGKAPKDWLECNGQQLAVQQYQALYALLGTRYGGTTGQNFMLPDLRGRVPVGAGAMPDSNRIGVTHLFNGDKGGSETVALTTAQMPAHVHELTAHPGNAAGAAVGNAIPSTSTKQATAPASAPAAPPLYAAPNPLQPMNSAAVTIAGGGAAHENRQPYLPLIYCIAVQGVWPPQPW
ncbi:MAG: hypothetical protein CVT77_14645 [Alphaproteobacteria bacterium HGW-Alphaproteobacteria-16]|nr:MAG: hypothetical protein CVT77_14645 [Alphaproteobacteria bacterium HGW-Alphaproteobacteria-16]